MTKRVFGVALAAGFALLLAGTARAASTSPIVATHLENAIGDNSASILDDAISKAHADGAQAVVVVLDSAGGPESAMRHMVQSIRQSTIPVVVYVPDGARADAAAFFVAQAANVLAVAPTGQLGSSHPVQFSGPNQADSVAPLSIEQNPGDYAATLASETGRDGAWAQTVVRQGTVFGGDQAVVRHLADFTANDQAALLQSLNGRHVGSTTLSTAGAAIETADASGWSAFVSTLSTPDAAFLLLIIAVGFLSLWLAHPTGIPMLVVAAIAAVGAAIGFSNLPTDPIGLGLLGAAFVFLLVDITATTHGLLTAVGAVAMALGGWLVVGTSTMDYGVSPILVVGSVLAIVAAYSLLLPKLIAVRKLPHHDFATQLIGQVATVREPLSPQGMVMVEGALWHATVTRGPVPEGDPVRVTSVDGLKLTVETLPDEGKTANAAKE